MKRICLLVAFLVCFASLSVSAADVEKGFVPETEKKITADAVYLKNLDTGKVMYEKNADQKIYPASLTKIMTVVLALENTANLETEMVTYPIEIQDYLYNYRLEHGSISTGSLIAGEQRSMLEYIYASMLPSANEASMSIAVHVGGTIEGFSELMNQRALELGMEGTSFVNSTGLYDDNQYSTARDLAILTEHALDFEIFNEIMSTYKYTAGPSNMQESIEWVSTIELQNPEHKPGDLYYYEGIKGVKTGTVPESGQSYISTIEKDGFRYMLVIIGSDMELERRALVEAQAIYDWVFSSFRNQTLVNEKEVVGEIPVRFSRTASFVQLETEGHFTALMPNNIVTSGSDSKVRKILEVPDSLDAPIKKGEYIGDYIVEINGEEAGRVRLVAKESLTLSQSMKFWNSVKELSNSFWFKFVLITIVLLIVVFIGIMVLRARNRRKKNRAFRTRPPKY